MKLVVSQKDGKSYQKEFETLGKLLNKKIGDKVSGDDFGLNGYELTITGGSDKDGFPMRKDVHGTKRQKILLTGGVGFKPKRKGERRKKSVRGNTVNPDTAQVNTKIEKQGKETVAQLWGAETKTQEKPVKEEAKREKKSEEEKPKETKPKKQEKNPNPEKKPEPEKE